jgi:hypothetical protein
MMRLRLFHQLFLLIAGTMLFTVMAVAFILSVSLRNGFSKYLSVQLREDQLIILASLRCKVGDQIKPITSECLADICDRFPGPPSPAFDEEAWSMAGNAKIGADL